MHASSLTSRIVMGTVSPSSDSATNSSDRTSPSGRGSPLRSISRTASGSYSPYPSSASTITERSFPCTSPSMRPLEPGDDLPVAVQVRKRLLFVGAIEHVALLVVQGVRERDEGVRDRSGWRRACCERAGFCHFAARESQERVLQTPSWPPRDGLEAPGMDDSACNGRSRHDQRARQVDLPGPLRPGKLRLMAETVTSSGPNDTPGPARMHAPHEGSISSAPAPCERGEVAPAPRRNGGSPASRTAGRADAGGDALPRATAAPRTDAYISMSDFLPPVHDPP